MTLGTVLVCTLAAVRWIRHVERNRVVEVGDVATEQVDPRPGHRHAVAGQDLRVRPPLE